MSIDISNQERAILQRIGREAASRRQVVTGRCVVCGEPFTGLRSRRYCSTRCRVRAHYHRAHPDASTRNGGA